MLLLLIDSLIRLTYDRRMQMNFMAFPFAFAIALAVALPAQGAWTHSNPEHPVVAWNRTDFVYDSIRDELLLVVPQLSTTEIQVWDGVDWSVRSSTSALPIAGYKAAVHDPLRDRLVIVNDANQMIEWDGQTWSTVGSTPLSGPNDLAYDPVLQRVVAVSAAGVFHWDGSTWQAVPNSNPPHGFNWRGPHLAYDSANSLLVCVGSDNVTNLHSTMEWDGSSWAAYASWHPYLMRTVYAPSEGAVVGLRSVGSTFRWDVASHTWQPVAGGSVAGGVHPTAFAIGYDQQRQRLVLNDYSIPYTLEFLPNYSGPVTWVVDPNSGMSTLPAAVAAANPGDRIIVRAANYALAPGPNPHVIDKGLTIACDPGVRFPAVTISIPATSPQRLMINGGRFESVAVALATDIHLRDCAITERFDVVGSGLGSMSIENCAIGTGIHNDLGHVAVATIGGAADVTIDGSSIMGSDSYILDPFSWLVELPSQALRVANTATVVITNSNVSGGAESVSSFGSLAGAAALRNTSASPVLVLGASTLDADVAPAMGAVWLSQDSLWLGPSAPSVVIPSLSRITASTQAQVGQSFSVDAVLQPGHAMFLMGAFGRQSTPVSWSRLPLLLPPNEAVLVTLLTSTNSSSITSVPYQASLIGLLVWMQGVAIDAGFDLQFSNARSIYIR